MNRRFLVDLVERTVATYAQSFVGLLVADSSNMLHLGVLKVAAVSALPAAFAVIKGALAGSVLSGGTASLLPSAPATAAAGGGSADAAAEVAAPAAPSVA